MLKFYQNAYIGSKSGPQRLHVAFAAAQCESLSIGEYSELLRFFSNFEATTCQQ